MFSTVAFAAIAFLFEKFINGYKNYYSRIFWVKVVAIEAFRIAWLVKSWELSEQKNEKLRNRI